MSGYNQVSNFQLRVLHFPGEDWKDGQWFSPLSPGIKMHILLSVLHTFLMALVRRICLNIKTSYPQ